MARTDAQTNLRLPAEVVSAIKAVAASNGRSLNAEVTAVLERYLETGGRRVYTKLRMPAQLRDSLARAAKASGRSLNAEIVLRLEQTEASTGGH